jgi:hypothetical protein
MRIRELHRLRRSKEELQQLMKPRQQLELYDELWPNQFQLLI